MSPRTHLSSERRPLFQIFPDLNSSNSYFFYSNFKNLVWFFSGFQNHCTKE